MNTASKIVHVECPHHTQSQRQARPQNAEPETGSRRQEARSKSRELVETLSKPTRVICHGKLLHVCPVADAGLGK
jgi:hypothetical protein